MNDFDDLTMMEIYHIECDDLCRQLNKSLLDLEESNNKTEYLDEIFRFIHTIKGSSRTVGRDHIADIAHAMEDYLATVREQKEVTSNHIDYLLSVTDWIKYLAHLSLDDTPPPSYAETLAQLISNGQPIDLPTAADIDTPQNPNQMMFQEDTLPPRMEEEGCPPEEKPAELTVSPLSAEQHSAPKNDTTDGTQRIPIHYLDSLFNLAGELYVKSTALETLKEDISKALNAASTLNYHCSILTNTVKESSGSPLKSRERRLKKQITAVTNKSRDIQKLLAPVWQSSDELNTQFHYLTSALQEEVMVARMIPLSRLFETFQRMVRDLSKDLKKKIHLKIEGEATRIDRAVIDILKVPMEHLIRNMIDHGIETPDIREKTGKPKEGNIRITAFQRGDDVIIRLEDDGQGIDVESIREKIVIQGRLSKEQADKLQKDELLEFIFLPGFTTRQDAGKLSGRGVGMDVVKTEIEKINGHVQVESTLQASTTFTLRLPLSLAITHTLLLESDQQVYAFPTSLVEKYLRFSPQEIQKIGGKHVLNLDDEIIIVVWLNQLMGQEVSNWETNKTYPALLFSMGNTKVAIIADRFIGESEIVVKPLDPRLKKVHHIIGASILNDGRVGLVVDIVDVLNAIRESEFSWESCSATESEHTADLKQILVVEDSLTIREMQRKLLQKAGYHVTLAVDGLDGINKIRRQSFDLIISDINMPRMDGLKMTKTLKSDDKYRHIPIIIVSYKDREEDKMSGLEAGADHYVTKSQFSSDAFLQLIAQLI